MGAWAQQFTISTVAGTGTQGFAGDGGPAKSAQLAMPTRVVVASNGNIYIADGLNHRIRMISNGTISTVAGNGTAGYTGDGASATSAELNNPTGIALDSSGNLYIADAANQVVRKVSSGTISTVAGNHSSGAGYTGDSGAATSARLNNPVAVAVDSFGNVFIADANNNVIREVASANISTVVGSAATTLQLNHPDGLAIDSAGVLYIADTANRRIVKFFQGSATVFAGNGTADFSGDNGPAVQAGLGDPVGVGVDAAGNVYIADTFNSRVRKVSPNGTITTIAGDGIEAYFGDGGLATNAGVYFPHDVASDAAGNIYIADTGNNAIRLLQPQPPAIFANGVVNAARYTPKISPGALASIFGPSFASGNLGASLPLKTTLGGVSVSVNGRAAPILYVTPTQVNFQVPWETAVGSASVTVTVNGRTSSAVSVSVLTAAPGLFVSASGRAVVQNAGSSLNSASNPAKVGSTITAYLTGSGPVSPAVADGAPAPANAPVLTSPVSVTIGGEAATVSFAGLAPGFVGLVQLNIVVPSGLATGDYPLAVTIAGETSNSGTISVTQ
jgi:uncharacterized protein (TIGR03437 family)